MEGMEDNMNRMERAKQTFSQGESGIDTCSVAGSVVAPDIAILFLCITTL